MFRKAGNFLSILALISLVNGHLALLQGVAWFRMTIDYSRTASFTVALAQTFDGQHPCALCDKIVAAKKHDQPLLRFNLLQDLKGLVASPVACKPTSPPSHEKWPIASVSFVPGWILTPPTQPPRALHA